MADRNSLVNDPETAIRYALDSRQSEMWTAFPAIVTSVNLVAMTLECVPAIQGVVTDENGKQSFVNLPKLVDCPICFPSAGGFTLTFPVKVNSEVLTVIANRCIDAWWQQGGIQPPIEFRMHDLSDGFAIPGPKSLPNVITGGINPDNAQLRSDDGTTYLEITPTGHVNIVAPGGMSVTTPILAVTGAITATGEITAKESTTDIALSAHIHSGVTTGSGDTGAPV